MTATEERAELRRHENAVLAARLMPGAVIFGVPDPAELERLRKLIADALDAKDAAADIALASTISERETITAALRARVQALEAALRLIIEQEASEADDPLDDATRIARRVLDMPDYAPPDDPLLVARVEDLAGALGRCADRLERCCKHVGNAPDIAAAAVQEYRDLIEVKP